MLLEFSIGAMFSDWVLPLVLFIMGLGLVVFVHELGHFLAAKAVGIKVEQFAVGFGKRLLGLKIGETDYRLNLIPLGGYVKMLGQEDFKPLTENDKPTPRSYESKSVGARFFVIASGVIMNIILAAVLFVSVGLIGRDVLAPTMGETLPGSPAFNATVAWETPLPGEPVSTTVPVITRAPDDEDLQADDDGEPQPARVVPEPPPFDPWGNRFQPGDRIVAMEGDSFVLRFSEGIANLADVKMVAALARPTDTYTFIIERTVDGVARQGRAQVGVFDSGGMLAFGIGAASSLTIGQWVGGDKEVAEAGPFFKGDTFIAINGHPVANQGDVFRIEQELTGEPVDLTVRRVKGGEAEITIPVTPVIEPSRNVVFRKNGEPVYFVEAMVKEKGIQYTRPDGSKITLGAADVDQEYLRILGMSPRLMVVGVVDRSNAARAGILPGDVILSYGDRHLPTLSGLLEINKQHAGKRLSMEVLRGGVPLTLTVEPKRRGEVVQIGLSSISDLNSTVVSDVLPGSAADKLGIAGGSTITAINGTEVATWMDVYRELSAAQGGAVEIAFTTRGGQSETGLIEELTPAAFHPRYYRYSVFPATVPLKPEMVKIKQDGIGDALVWGGKETVKLTLTSYASLRSLMAGDASVKHMAGPIGIGALAVKAGQSGMVEFMYFIAFISTAIAVFNFLPLPVLDGGHALFLIIEKIRGKPVPVKVLNYAQYIGMALLLLIFLAVTYQDIARLIGQWFW
ncbi:MAG: site-2 protease family protein [Phycisphaerae bacterium]|nr:site-2 protease family protein [Phycisphaerae bacterium]